MVDDIEKIFAEAAALEREYKWLKAANVLESALEVFEEDDFLKMGETLNKLGFCLMRAATQADSQAEFTSRIKQVVEAYEKAAEFFGRFEDSKVSHAHVNCCKAQISYIGFWLSDDPDKRREHLDECLRLEKESLKVCDGVKDKVGSGKACVALANYLSNRLDLELDVIEREKILDEAIRLGERAIEIFSEKGDDIGLSEAYCITSIHCYDGAMSMPEGNKIKECTEKAFEYSEKSIKHSEESPDKYVRGRAKVFRGFIEVDLGAGIAEGIKHENEALKLGLETKDHRLMAEVYDGLTYCTSWGQHLEENIDRVRQRVKSTAEYANEAFRHSELIHFGHGIPHSHMNLGTAYFWMGRREVDPDSRRDLMEKSVKILREGLEHAERTGSTHATYHLSVSTANCLSFLSAFKVGNDRRETLEEAMAMAEKGVYYTQQLRPNFYLVRGGSFWSVSRTQIELSKLEESYERKIELLEKSITNLKSTIDFFDKHIASFPPRVEVFAGVGDRRLELGDSLTQLYRLTNERITLRRVIESYGKAADNYEKAGLTGRIAEAYWKVAVIQDLLGEYLDSATSFGNASEKYRQSTQDMPELKKLYMDHAIYMEAWSEIERARHHHLEKRYGEAKEHYEKAAKLHESTEHWSYLAPNYRAWARLEEAEGLSRGEQTQKATGVFEKAAQLFNETKVLIKSKLDVIDDAEEAEMAERLLQASDMRKEYCQGRMAMEEARTLDRQGDHASSARKYGQAELSLKRVVDSMENEHDRSELKPLVLLCHAWQKTMMAEAMAAPSLYSEAAELFLMAKDNAVDQTTSLLAQAHSSFCKALEVGTEFEITRETEYYQTAKRHIEAATSYYLRIGYQSASEYTTATNRLLDAYMYMYGAQTETDPGKKARLYQLAERLLQSSAGSYIKAKHPEKSEEVLRVLEKIKEEKEIAMTLSEIMHAPSVVATTSSFSTPTPTYERAVGLERFENADIQANMIVSGRDIKVGEDIALEIELVNAGKAPAQLIKVEEIIPKGFDIRRVPDTCRVEDSYLDMKGRTLSPLKTAELKLVLRPRDKGTYNLSPRVLYLDREGKYRSHEPEPVTVVVKEMGIRGWLKGPTR